MNIQQALKTESHIRRSGWYGWLIVKEGDIYWTDGTDISVLYKLTYNDIMTEDWEVV